MLVDFSTTEKNLEDLMLSEYPGKIFKEQIKKIGEGENKTYRFFGLDYRKLSYFLMIFFDETYEFKIFEHKTGKLIEDNNIFPEPFYCH